MSIRPACIFGLVTSVILLAPILGTKSSAVTSWLTRSARCSSNGKPLLLLPGPVSLWAVQGAGGSGESPLPSRSQRSTHLPMAPSLPLPPAGVAAPLHPVLISWGAAPCPELGRAGGVGQACPCRCCGRGWKQRGLGSGAALPPPGSAAGQPPISHPPPFFSWERNLQQLFRPST